MTKTYPQVRCYESHPALELLGFKIYGGSCGHPIVHDADIYVGFDFSHWKSPKAYPWEPGVSFHFPIQDMRAPDDPVQFKKLIDWLAVQLIAGQKIHLGCIGGHGRTGTALAALVAVLEVDKDAIGYVRKNYCQRAVESSAQVDFLVKHYGVLPAAGHKEGAQWSGHGGLSPFKEPAKKVSKITPGAPIDGLYTPAKNPCFVWGPAVAFDK